MLAPIFPLSDVNASVGVVNVPVPVIVPDPVAVSVSVVPEMLEFTTMLPPEPVASSDSPAEAVIVPEVVIVVAGVPVPGAKVSVRLTVAPVEAALTFTALAESVRVTLPVELTVRLEALRLSVLVKLIPPEPAVRLAVSAASAPLAVMPPAASEAFIVKEEAKLAANEMTPA